MLLLVCYCWFIIASLFLPVHNCRFITNSLLLSLCYCWFVNAASLLPSLLGFVDCGSVRAVLTVQVTHDRRVRMLTDKCQPSAKVESRHLPHPNATTHSVATFTRTTYTPGIFNGHSSFAHLKNCTGHLHLHAQEKIPGTYIIAHKWMHAPSTCNCAGICVCTNAPTNGRSYHVHSTHQRTYARCENFCRVDLETAGTKKEG